MSATSRKRSPGRYLVLGAIAAILMIAFLWIVVTPGPMHFARGQRVRMADYRGPDPTGVPAELASASLIERGSYLAHAADCEVCHSAPGGAPYAGGVAFVLPFGTLYSTNITPDADTGIGHYSDANFLKSLHQGIRPDGTHLYLSLIHISEPTRRTPISYAVFCLKKKKKK